MERNRTHRALEILEDACKGCSHCMRVCPTEALRVHNGKALLYSDWCIDCGECFRVCEARAIRVMDDDFDHIFDYKYRVLLVPAVFFAQFDPDIPRESIYQILGSMGFSEVCTVEQSVDSLISEMNKYVKNAEKPVISSFCPAVIRLIQVRFPSLVDRIMMLIPPLEITAKYYNQKFEAEHRDSADLGIFYLTPCIAKVAAVKAPVGGYTSPINGVINMDYIYNKVLLAYKNNNWESSDVVINSELSSKGAVWPTTGGESCFIEGRSLAIDGMSNVIEFLEMLEDEEISDADFLELRACDESCAGGILTQGNRFMVADYLREICKEYPDKHSLFDDYNEHCSPYIRMDAVEPRSMIRYDKDINVAIKKMEKARMLKEYLPSIDCGACGAPSCDALAADIVRDDAKLNSCIFLQTRFQREGSLSSEEAIEIMETIWGKDRFVNKNKKNR